MDDIIAVLENIHDPEIPVNIYELGLIYDIKNIRSRMILKLKCLPLRRGVLLQE